jgi:asparagine synthase (glutamine-hydrolysing)
VPREIVERKKHGFAVPIAQLLRGALKAPVRAALLDRSSPLGDWFRRESVEALWNDHQSGRRDHRKKLWSLYCLAVSIRNTGAAAA